MFVRKKPNKSGKVSIQIIDKSSGKYRVIKTVGSSDDPKEIEKLYRQAHHMIPSLMNQSSFDFLPQTDQLIIDALKNDSNTKIHVTGPEVVLGSIFDWIGFNRINDSLFRHLVIARLVCPASKLSTIDYLHRYVGVKYDISKVYRFLDKLNRDYKNTAEGIAYSYTVKVLEGDVSVVFYDMTTLYFEAEHEDDFRKTGFSKDGKPQNPQILLGLLVGKAGYPIGYELFDGNTFEGHTLIPVLERFQTKYNLPKPIIIADAGLLSNPNIEQLVEYGYQYILGARIKNESADIKEQILNLQLSDGESQIVYKPNATKLVIGFTDKRAKKDTHNRKRGLDRLEKKIKSGKLTKAQINNKGYNKYLKLTGELKVEVDHDKFKQDARWDGLKGYLTNTELSAREIISNYNQLWNIEKSFRVSKSELKVRPVFHRAKRRIEAHISISFCAYTIYKELERLLKINKASFSVTRAIELTQTIYSLSLILPESQIKQTIQLPLDQQQNELCQIVKSIRVSQ